jgi:iron-dependent peroxidase
VAYQADPVAQFVPIQKRLEQLDMLNTWTVPVGSAVFAIPAGVREEGGYIGESLFA